jgi:diphosphomevalonate decarboxylase
MNSPKWMLRVKASPNIALIKYWGKADSRLNLPLNASLSLGLGDLFTELEIESDVQDRLTSDQCVVTESATHGFESYLHRVRQRFPQIPRVHVHSRSNFPMSCGIASSASFYAALAKALMVLADEGSPSVLGQMARWGSGSATRSVPEGAWVGWLPGTDETSYGFALDYLALPSTWEDVMLVYDLTPKALPSRLGHRMMEDSPIREARQARADLRYVYACRFLGQEHYAEFLDCILEETLDFVALLRTHLLQPYLSQEAWSALKWLAKYRVTHSVQGAWCVTVDAGSTLHVIGDRAAVSRAVEALPFKPVLILHSKVVSEGAQVISETSRSLSSSVRPGSTMAGL